MSMDMEDDRDLLQKTYQQNCEEYGTTDADVDVQPLLNAIYQARMDRLNEREAAWKQKYLEKDFSAWSVEQLKSWKENTAQIPGYLTAETIAETARMKETVDALLSQKKVNYIVSLINDLSEAEREQLRCKILI